MRGIKKALLILVGCIGVVFGTIGTFVPLLPTVPLYLLAAVCFARSSERLHTWFTTTKMYRDNLDSYVRGEGMPLKAKLRIFLLSTFTLSFGFFMMDEVPVGRIIVSVLWLIILYVIWFRIKTYKEN